MKFKNVLLISAIILVIAVIFAYNRAKKQPIEKLQHAITVETGKEEARTAQPKEKEEPKLEDVEEPPVGSGPLLQ